MKQELIRFLINLLISSKKNSNNKQTNKEEKKKQNKRNLLDLPNLERKKKKHAGEAFVM